MNRANVLTLVIAAGLVCGTANSLSAQTGAGQTGDPSIDYARRYQSQTNRQSQTNPTQRPFPSQPPTPSTFPNSNRQFAENEAAAAARAGRSQSSRQPIQLTRPGADKDSASGKRSNKKAITSVWTTFGALGFVIALILLAAKLFQRHVPNAVMRIPTEAVEILGRRPVDQRQSIHLVRCGSRILVLGSSTNGLTTLAEVTDPVEVDYLAGLCRHDDKEVGIIRSFRDMFQSSTPAGKSPSAGAAADKNGNSAGQAVADTQFNRELLKRANITPDLSSQPVRETLHE